MQHQQKTRLRFAAGVSVIVQLAAVLITASCMDVESKDRIYECRVTKIVRGDTFECVREGSLDQNTGKPRRLKVSLSTAVSPRMQDVYGKQSAALLSNYILKKNVNVRVIALTGSSDVIADVSVGDFDVSRGMLVAGFAWARRGFDGEAENDMAARWEREAREGEVGMWRGSSKAEYPVGN